MTCNRGKANPNALTRYRLFADSAGRCQNPNCLESLFVDTAGKFVNISQVAHIVAASDGGPRSEPRLSEEAKGSWENLILFCANCHIVIDKAEENYPLKVLLDWKRTHREKVEDAFGLGRLQTRFEAFDRLSQYRAQNRTVFDTYGPTTDHRFDPESGVPTVWRRHVLETILPNNRAMLHLMDRNAHLLTTVEEAVVERFRIHVTDFEQRHLNSYPKNGGQRFPSEVDSLFCELRCLSL
jgi:hypothetical protein